jgi:LacI family transcriptional regulator
LRVPRSRDRARAVDMRAIAAKAGVALSSVSCVLNPHPDVSPDMRRKVVAAADMLGYEPDLLAQSLRRGRTKLVGCVVRDITSPLFAAIVTGAEDRLRQDGHAILLTNSESDPELDAAHIHLLSRRRVDGLMVSVASEAHPATLRALESARSPIVLLDREVPGLTAATVLCDHASRVQSAVSALFELGIGGLEWGWV